MSEDVEWFNPAWDWPENDYAWLASRSGIEREEDDGGHTSIFFIRGGRILHQAHLPPGEFSPEEFCALIQDRAEGLEGARVVWSEATGDGDAGFWIEGTRPPNDEDLGRLEDARDRQRRQDEIALRAIEARRALDAQKATSRTGKGGEA